GEFDAGLQAFVAEHYYTPPRIDVTGESLPSDLPLGVWWFDEPGVHLIYEGGVAVHFREALLARALNVQVTGMRAFRFRFVRDGEVLGEAMDTPLPSPPDMTPLQMVAGLRAERVIVPAAVAAFDTLWIDCIEIP